MAGLHMNYHELQQALFSTKLQYFDWSSSEVIVFRDKCFQTRPTGGPGYRLITLEGANFIPWKGLLDL